MCTKQIELFERRNPKISVSIFGFENNQIFSLHISSIIEYDHHIDLLLVTNEDIFHYILIRNKNQLFKNIMFPKSHYPIFICDFCLNKFRYRHSLENHIVRCKLNKPQVTRFPSEPNNVIKWDTFNKKIKQPVAIYSDFETMNIDGNFIASSYAYVIVDDTHTPIAFREYRAKENVIKHFLDTLIKDVDDIEESRIDHKIIQWTPEDKKRYLKSTHCHMCEEHFDSSITDLTHPKARVADHYHFEFPHTKLTKFNRPCHNVVLVIENVMRNIIQSLESL